MRAFATLRSLSAVIAALLALTAPSQSQQQKPDAATSAWWAQTVALSNDAMEGRDTGTEAYERAAKYVADQFAAAGLKPAGDNGTFFQRVPMHQVDLVEAKSSVEILPAIGVKAGAPTATIPLKLLEEVTTVPHDDLPPRTEGNMVFLGYGAQSSAE